MKHIKVVKKQELNKVCESSGCGECRSSCQSACKTSCTVGNQPCEQTRIHTSSQSVEK